MSWVRVLILNLARLPIYGHQISKAFGAFGKPISPGTLYPMLHAMERDGLLNVKLTTCKGRVRKYYDITSEGLRVWDAAVHDMRRILQRVSA